MRWRIQRKTIFDLDNYFVLNYTPPLHWGIIHVLPKYKCIVCFDGFHGKEHDKYKNIKNCLNILSNELNIIEYKDCEWKKKNIDKYLLSRHSDGWNCGKFVSFYTYHIIMNGYVTKYSEDATYLVFLRQFILSCLFEANKNNEPTLSTLGWGDC